MNTEEIIASGRLELYVSGSLPDKESEEIEAAIAKDPDLQREVEAIETSLISLAETIAPPLPAMLWTYILSGIQKTRSMKNLGDRKTNWITYSGWAATIVAVIGIFWMMNQNNSLKEEIEITTIDMNSLEEQIETTEESLSDATQILEILRSKEFNAIILSGNQAVAPEAFAKVYFNKKDNMAYVDTEGLPAAPEGKVYQVWSLKLDPLTPVSVGLINRLSEAGKGIHMFTDIPAPEAFGITLEPEGGSETPTLSQLYTLGTVTP